MPKPVLVRLVCPNTPEGRVQAIERALTGGVAWISAPAAQLKKLRWELLELVKERGGRRVRIVPRQDLQIGSGVRIKGS